VQVIDAPMLVGRIRFFDTLGLYDEVGYIDDETYNRAIADARDARREIRATRLTGQQVPSVETGFYFCDSIGFAKVAFDPKMARKPDNLLRVIAKEPNKPAYETEIANTLKAFQQAVGGYIETYTVDKSAVIICNEEGKLCGMEPNCMINYELLVGTVFVVGSGNSGDGEFCSLDGNQTAKYLDMFSQSAITADRIRSYNGGMKMM
jgi:hypothetical protein